MEKLIDLSWYDAHDGPVYGTAIVEYTRYDDEEDGTIVNEVINVFLPEHVHSSQFHELKKHAIEAFHNGEGYNM